MLPAPSERVASTNSRSRIDSVLPRTIRAMYGQVKSAITKITSPRPGLTRPPRHPSVVVPHAATMPIANSRSGIASMTSTPRDRRVDPAAEVAGDHPDHRPDQHGDAGRERRRRSARSARRTSRGRRGRARPGRRRTEVLVRALGETELVEHLALVEVVRAVARDPRDERREEREEDRADDRAERRERRLVLLEAGPEECGRATDFLASTSTPAGGPAS